MAGSKDGKAGIMARIRLWVRTEVISEVPPELAACEFHCREHQCLQEKWENCENRLRVARGCED